MVAQELMLELRCWRRLPRVLDCKARSTSPFERTTWNVYWRSMLKPNRYLGYLMEELTRLKRPLILGKISGVGEGDDRLGVWMASTTSDWWVCWVTWSWWMDRERLWDAVHGVAESDDNWACWTNQIYSDLFTNLFCIAAHVDCSKMALLLNNTARITVKDRAYILEDGSQAILI